MKAIVLGKLRINLAHLVWFMPSGKPGSDEATDQPSIVVKTVDAEQAVTIQYTSFEKRDGDLEALDVLCNSTRATDAAAQLGDDQGSGDSKAERFALDY